jgi:hypothetical protein
LAFGNGQTTKRAFFGSGGGFPDHALDTAGRLCGPDPQSLDRYCWHNSCMVSYNIMRACLEGVRK